MRLKNETSIEGTYNRNTDGVKLIISDDTSAIFLHGNISYNATLSKSSSGKYKIQYGEWYDLDIINDKDIEVVANGQRSPGPNGIHKRNVV